MHAAGEPGCPIGPLPLLEQAAIWIFCLVGFFAAFLIIIGHNPQLSSREQSLHVAGAQGVFKDPAPRLNFP